MPKAKTTPITKILILVVIGFAVFYGFKYLMGSSILDNVAPKKGSTKTVGGKKLSKKASKDAIKIGVLHGGGSRGVCLQDDPGCSEMEEQGFAGKSPENINDDGQPGRFPGPGGTRGSDYAHAVKISEILLPLENNRDLVGCDLLPHARNNGMVT